MACLLLLLIVLFPRVALALLFLFTTYLDPVFHNILILIAGFIFLPLTTLLYAWMIHSGLAAGGVNLLWLMLAALVDLGAVGGGARHRWGS
jgi:hypothetical protein